MRVFGYVPGVRSIAVPCCGGSVPQGRGEGGANGLRRTGVLLSVALVAAAFAPHAHAADDPGPPPSPPAALVFASTASIAPDVPETSGVADAATPVDELAVPSDLPAPVTVAVAKKPANSAGWVEVRAAPLQRASRVIPARTTAVPSASTPAAPHATHRAAVKRRVPQYHGRPAQYHRPDVTTRPSESTRALLVPTSRHDGALMSADAEPSDGSQDPGDPCTSEPPICPDLCGDIPVQNSLQNVAEIVRCIVNAVTQEIGAQVPPAAPGDTSDGQYHCDDPQYQGPPCEQTPPAATPAAPPADTPAPDAAPATTPTPTSGSTAGPSAPVGATPAGPSTTHGGGADTSKADDGWQLVRAAPHRPAASHAVVAAISVPPATRPEVAHARVAVSRVHRAAHPARRLAPAARGGHHAALATAARASAPGDSDAWPLRTMIILLALATLALTLAAVAKVNGAGAAASVRARLGSRGLSRGGGPAANRKRGIRYRE
jgi:hypothetical protein